jgi:hypothetical protein
VREVLAAYAYYNAVEPEPVEPEFYTLFPEIEERLDIPHELRLSPALGRLPGLTAFKAVYRAGPENPTVKRDFSWPHARSHYSSTRSTFRVHYVAGYTPGKAPADLVSACLELAAWNMARYRGPPPRSGFFIGMTGNVRGSGKDGEHLEAFMPENVRLLLEPYRRKTI